MWVTHIGRFRALGLLCTVKKKPTHAIAAGVGKDVMKKYITKILSWFHTLGGVAAR